MRGRPTKYDSDLILKAKKMKAEGFSRAVIMAETNLARGAYDYHTNDKTYAVRRRAAKKYYLKVRHTKKYVARIRKYSREYNRRKKHENKN